MPPVSHIHFLFLFLLCFAPLLIVFFLGDIFLHVDPTFAALDETVKEIPNRPYSPVLYDTALNDGSFFTFFACLTNLHSKAKALLPVLAISCLLLNSSTCHVDKHLLQPVFGSVYFFNRAKLMSFPIHSRSSHQNYFSPQAMGHLNGQRLMDLMSQSEEAFIWFVILVDLMHYHHHSLHASLRKYQVLFQ